jgi:hypothetical protein
LLSLNSEEIVESVLSTPSESSPFAAAAKSLSATLPAPSDISQFLEMGKGVFENLRYCWLRAHPRLSLDNVTAIIRKMPVVERLDVTISMRNVFVDDVMRTVESWKVCCQNEKSSLTVGFWCGEREIERLKSPRFNDNSSLNGGDASLASTIFRQVKESTVWNGGLSVHFYVDLD